MRDHIFSKTQPGIAHVKRKDLSSNPHTARALVKNPKAWGPGPSNSYFSMQANLHHHRPRVPQILKAFLVVIYVLHASAQFGASLNEVRTEKCFLQSWACLSFMRAVRKKYSLKTCFFLARPGLSEFHKIRVQKKMFFFSKPSFSEFREAVRKKHFFRAWKIIFPQLQPMLNPALCSQGKERESEGKLPWRQGYCRIMVRVSDLNFEGRRINSQWWTFPGTALFSELLGNTLFQVPKSTQILSLHGLEAFQASAKKNNFWELEKLIFCKAPTSSQKTTRGHATQEMNRKGELQTSHISSNLRIWQSVAILFHCPSNS